MGKLDIFFCLDWAIGVAERPNYDLNPDSSNFDDGRGLWWTQNCLLWVSYLKPSTRQQDTLSSWSP